MRGPALVLLGIEDTLVGSAAIRARCWTAALGEHGFDLERDRFAARFDGRSDAAARASIEAEFGRALPEGFTAALEARLIGAFERELRATPDAAGTLRRLRRPLAALSGFSRPVARRALEVAGLWDSFQPHLFTTAMATREPPAADLYQLAAAEMGVPIRQTLLIESSVNGVRGGRAAGMTVFGYAGGHADQASHGAKLEAAGAQLVIDRMSELAPLVQARAV